MKELIHHVLNQSTLLKTLSYNEEQMVVKKLRKGQIISDYINAQSYIGLILKGSINVYTVTSDNKTVIVSTLYHQDIFGISNIFLEKQNPTVLCCKQPSIVLFIPKDIIKQSIQEDPVFAMNFATLCNQKIQFLLKRIEELTTQKSQNKLYDYLATHMDQNKQVSITSRDALAEYLGISRATLFREIAKLKKQGKLEVHKNYFVIL